MLTLSIINKHDTSLYSLINYKNEIVRLYHEDYGTMIHYNEFCYYLDFLIPHEYHFYIIYNKPNHNKIFTKDDLNFLSMNIEFINKLDVEPTHSETIQFFKEEKEKLLLYLENIQNLYFYFFIPRLSTDNKFYYDLLLLFKDDYNIKSVSDYSSPIVLVDKVLYLNNFNYSLNFFKLFFNFEDQTYKNNSLNKFQMEVYNKNNKDFKKWPETIAYNNYKNDFSAESKVINEKLKMAYYNKLDNSYDKIYFKKMAYQTLCKNWWIINDRWNKYPIWHSNYKPTSLESEFERSEFTFFCNLYNSSSFITTKIDKNGEVFCEDYLEWGSFCENLFSFSKDYNFVTGNVKMLK